MKGKNNTLRAGFSEELSDGLNLLPLNGKTAIDVNGTRTMAVLSALEHLTLKLERINR